MKAWQVTELGEPEDVLRQLELPDPTPGKGQVLVRVRAVPANFPDALMCRGLYQVRPELPFTPGVELCGEVVALGEGVSESAGLAVGDRVIGAPTLPYGGFAELALLEAAMTFPAPASLDDAEAASLFIGYQTGWFALHRRTQLAAGETLLVHAAAGGVGSAAIQLGKAAGATVIATAGGERKVQVCRDLGADHAVDYTSEDFVSVVKEVTGGRGADVIYDPVGGDVFDQSRKCVAFEGRIVVVGFTSGRIPEAPANHLLVKNYSVVGLHWGLYRKYDPAVFGQVHEELTRLVAAGSVDPLVGAVHPLEEAPQALKALADRGTVGKVVLVP
jgi:NADPH2:quinone reductase